VAFFHPNCNAGGGGERVLWCSINAIKKRYPSINLVIYANNYDVNATEILSKVQKTFNLKVDDSVQLINLKSCILLESKCYPILTLLGQSFGSILVGIEALFRQPPNIYIDTVGFAFTMPLFKYLGNCSTISYVHYPTISSDMLNIVKCQNNSFNNRAIISNSHLLTSLKLFYYRVFAGLYGACGRCSDVALVNSSWTEAHIKELWTEESLIKKVFPPCDITRLLSIHLERSEDQILILSVAQFRPEKDHMLQVKSFSRFLTQLSSEERLKYKLVMAGGCRNAGDEARVKELQVLCESLEVTENVEIKTNVSYEELKLLLSSSHVGIHTMKNEHFGIGVVEFQAAGLVVLSNNSGGPKSDIVEEVDGKLTGFLASDEDSYANCLHQIFKMSSKDRMQMLKEARRSSLRFSDEQFQKNFISSISAVFDKKLSWNLKKD